VFKTIVVGTDGSARASQAVAAAGSLASQTGASLHVVCAYQPATVAMANALALGGTVPMGGEDEAEAARTIAAEAAASAGAVGSPAKAYAVERTAATALCEVARAVGADLIVVGNRGMTGKGRVLGSVPNTVAHHAPCAVLIVPTTA
jgi:nucleotide-binding universal stress UspA family protein